MLLVSIYFVFFFSSRRRHTRWPRDWSSDVCSSDLAFHHFLAWGNSTFRALSSGASSRVTGASAAWRSLWALCQSTRSFRVPYSGLSSRHSQRAAPVPEVVLG